jgi:hypothetical protein
MKIATSIAFIALSSLIQPSFAQQTPSPAAPGAQAQQTAPTPAQVDAQIAKMQELMTQMNQQMAQLQQTQDPEERQRLLQQHWTTMQDAMTTMHGMWGAGAAGCCAGGGRMMGPMMMWNDYRSLTTEQLRQRQYMMDRWMPMQQMMMDHMMQRQNMMMPQPTPGR